MGRQRKLPIVSMNRCLYCYVIISKYFVSFAVRTVPSKHIIMEAYPVDKCFHLMWKH